MVLTRHGLATYLATVTEADGQETVILFLEEVGA